jgi:hypothetical protein
VAALGRGDLADASRTGLLPEDAGFETLRGRAANERPSLVMLALLVATAAAAGIAVLKWLARRIRYVTADPRRTAAASRRELEAFLRDQGIAVTPSATLDDLARAVRDELGVEASAYFEAAGVARFGEPRDASRAARRARNELRVLLRRARRELSAWARLRGFVSLRSLRGWQG